MDAQMRRVFLFQVVKVEGVRPGTETGFIGIPHTVIVGDIAVDQIAVGIRKSVSGENVAGCRLRRVESSSAAVLSRAEHVSASPPERYEGVDTATVVVG